MTAMTFARFDLHKRYITACALEAIWVPDLETGRRRQRDPVARRLATIPGTGCER